jgi:quinolinate synthase
MIFTDNQLKTEATRLYKNLKNTGWNLLECQKIAPTTLQINFLKKEQNAIILAHSYQSPDIMYGVADFIGDSYGLSKLVNSHPSQKIIFSSVHFMGETAKLLNFSKQILVPAVAGCSLADSITPFDVKNLRQKYPKAVIVCYINTSAAVKAECDVCCTSANAIKIIENLDYEQIVFLPDEYMGKNIQNIIAKTQPKKEIILWKGRCIVHEIFTPEEIDFAKKIHPDIKILAHLECSSEVIQKADLAGSTNDILDYVKNSPAQTFMLVTECGITDRVKNEFANKKIVGTCNLCPFMRSINLQGVLKALKNPSKDQIIEIPPLIFEKAKKSIDNMFLVESSKFAVKL